jgi:hypothetical protein
MVLSTAKMIAMPPFATVFGLEEPIEYMVKLP